jgi:hypothetical protein
MAQIIEVAADNAAALKLLESFIQSGNLNFLVGSGASSPAIRVAGSIESEINTLLASGDDHEANVRSIEFIEEIDKIQSELKSGPTAATMKVAQSYGDFVACIDKI